MAVFEEYKRSFIPKKEHGYALLCDGLFLLLTVGIFYAFNYYLKQKVKLFGSFSSPAQFQEALLRLPPAEMQAMILEIRSVLVILILGIVGLLLFTLLLYSFSQAFLWHLSLKHKLQYWRWNWLHLVLMAFALLYAFLALILNLLLTYVVTSLTINPDIRLAASNIFHLFFLLFFVLFLFVVQYAFASRYKVFSSVGEAFKLISTHSAKLRWVLLFALGTAIIPVLLMFPLRNRVYSSEVLLIINAIITIVYLAWLRFYIVQTFHETQSH